MRKFLTFLSIVLFIGVLVYFQSDLLKVYKALPQIPGNLPQVIKNIEKEISAPQPLRAPTAPKTSVVLTKAGVISQTNLERKNNGALPALKENPMLDAAAQIKLKDMFAKQYFEHISPSGVGPGDLADKVGYDYIYSGENLALGNFNGDIDLVTAWMNSPGHRANILNNKYQEIGVAVGKGMFEGRETWLAVQEFGMPRSACPSPDAALKASIDSDENALTALKTSADQLKADLESSNPKTREENKIYNQKVDEYNALAKQINVLIEELKVLVSKYNAEVEDFNLCAGK